MSKGKHVLVLGGAGFLGRHLCKKLVDTGYKVSCIDLQIPEPKGIIHSVFDKIEWYKGSLSDRKLVTKALTGVDVVFHLVSSTIPATSNNDLVFDLASNVETTLQLLEIIKETDVRKVVFVSSGGTVYGVPSSIPISEEHETNPICGYGIHKLAIEKYLFLYQHNYGLDYCVLRLSNPYGTEQISERVQGVIGNFIYKTVMDETMDIWGDGSVVRDFIYIDDVVSAFLSAMHYSGNQRIFNIGSGEGHTLKDIIMTIEKLSGSIVSVTYSPSRQVDVPLNILDISKAKKELLWTPEVDIYCGLSKMLEYAKENLK